MRTKIIITLICLLAMQHAEAQEVKIRVNAGSEPVPYAYIFINQQIAGNTDSTGVCVLSKDSLQVGDKLSASFLENAATIPYDRVIAAAGECVIDIGSLQLEELVITAEDTYKLYRKYVKEPGLPYAYYHKYATHFNFSGKIYDTPRTCEGEISVYMGNWKNPQPVALKFKASGDTAGVVPSLIRELDIIVYNQFAARVSKKNALSYSGLQYLGRKDGHHIFIRSAEQSDENTVIQYKIYSDINTGYVNRTDCYYYRNKNGRETYAKRETYYTPEKRGKRLLIVAANSYVNWGNGEYIIQLSDISISQHRVKF